MVGKKSIRALAFAALTFAPLVARADDTAQSLFDDGNALAAKGDYAAACPKLAESLRLEPAVGTQFNLADCYEHLGRVATAYVLYIDVIRIAHSAGKFQREEAAKERAEAVKPKVPHVTVKVAATAPGLTLALDDKELTRDRWSEAIALDPGEHRLRASAPGRNDFEAPFTLAEGEASEVAIPELVDPNPPPPVAPALEPPKEPKRSSARKVAAPIAGGIALAGLAAGSIAGAIALSKKGHGEDLCPEATYHFHCPTTAGADAWSSAASAGDVSTIAFAVGGVALATAVVLWITAPSKPKSTATWSPGLSF